MARDEPVVSFANGAFRGIPHRCSLTQLDWSGRHPILSRMRAHSHKHETSGMPEDPAQTRCDAAASGSCTATASTGSGSNWLRRNLTDERRSVVSLDKKLMIPAAPIPAMTANWAYILA